MFRDRLILAGLAGALADALIHWGCVLSGLVKVEATIAHYLAVIIFAGHNPAAGQILLGQLAHIISGGVLGVTVLFLLSRSRRQWALVKGAALGAAFWLNQVIIAPSFVAARVRIEQSMAGVLLGLAALTTWGAVTAVILARLLARIPDRPAGGG